MLELTAITRSSVAGKLAATFLRVLSASLVGIAIGLRASTVPAPLPVALCFALAAATASVTAWFALTAMRPPVSDPTAD